MDARAGSYSLLRRPFAVNGRSSFLRRRYRMSPLREQLLRELQLRRYAPSTQKHYVSAVYGLAAHYRVAPDQLSATQVQDYLLYVMQQRQLNWNTVNTIASG